MVGADIIRVAHVIHSLGPGGAEKVLTELATAAPAAGLQVIVISLSPVDDALHARTLRSLGVDVVELGRHRWDPRSVVDTVAALRERRVDVVHTHLKHADIVGGLAAWRLGLPQVSTLHLIEQPHSVLGRGKLVAASLVRNAHARRILAVSRAQREWYISATRVDPTRVVVVPNGVRDAARPDSGVVAGLRAALQVEDDAVVGLMAAVMRPGKGHDTLLAALRRLPDESPLVVAVAGDGPLLPRLRAEVDADPVLARRVRLLGYRSDVADLMHAVDLVVHPSEADALPTTLIEAAAAGRPIVASDVGGVPDVVGGPPGVVGDAASLLVEPRDPEALAEALAHLTADAALRHRLGQAGRARFLADFTLPLWVSRLRMTYVEALDEQSHARGSRRP